MSVITGGIPKGFEDLFSEANKARQKQRVLPKYLSSPQNSWALQYVSWQSLGWSAAHTHTSISSITQFNWKVINLTSKIALWQTFWGKFDSTPFKGEHDMFALSRNGTVMLLFIVLWKHILTAAGHPSPVLHCDIGLLAADPGVCLHELALQPVLWRVCAQSVNAGRMEGFWRDVHVASGEGILPQEFTPVSITQKNKKRDMEIKAVMRFLVKCVIIVRVISDNIYSMENV